MSTGNNKLRPTMVKKLVTIHILVSLYGMSVTCPTHRHSTLCPFLPFLQAPGLLRRSPTAIASKICTISESTGIEFGRITSLLVRAGACRMLLFSPMNIVHRLEAIAGVFGLQPDEKLVQDREEVEGDKRPTRADLKRSVRGHALCLAETQPGLLLRTDLDKLRGVGRVVMRELDEMRTEVSSSAGQP